MRSFVVEIASYSRQVGDSTFIVIPQNGHELLTLDGEPDGPTASLSLLQLTAETSIEFPFTHLSLLETTPGVSLHWQGSATSSTSSIQGGLVMLKI